MRGTVLASMVLMTTGCTVAHMVGFDSMAARGDLDEIDVTGVPALYKGSFRVGGATGTVRRLERAEAAGWGPDAIGSPYQIVEEGLASRAGTIELRLDREDVGDSLEARCRYGRTEIRSPRKGVTVAEPYDPLFLQCVYRIDEREVGRMEMAAVPPGRSDTEPRAGRIELLGRVLGIRSVHGIDGLSFPSSPPMGYVLNDDADQSVGAIETQSGSTRRMLLPRSGADRAPALAAMVTLALFWDPGNTG